MPRSARFEEALQLAAELWKQQNSAQPPQLLQLQLQLLLLLQLQLQLQNQELRAELAAKDEQLKAGDPAVKAHDKFLAMGDNITLTEASQFVEGQDFEVFHNIVKNPSGGRPRTEYAVSIECAKHIAMMEQTARGRQVRQYFIDVEVAARAKEIPSTPELLIGAIEQLVERAKKGEAAILELETKDELLRTSLANNQEAILQIEAKDAQLEAQAPAVECFNKFLDTGANLTLRQTAGRLEVTEKKRGLTSRIVSPAVPNRGKFLIATRHQPFNRERRKV